MTFDLFIYKEFHFGRGCLDINIVEIVIEQNIYLCQVRIKHVQGSSNMKLKEAFFLSTLNKMKQKAYLFIDSQYQRSCI